jgi:dextranase
VRQKIFIVFAFGLVLAACRQGMPTMISKIVPTATETVMPITARISRLDWDKSFYKPGEAIQLTVHVAVKVERPVPARLTAQIVHLDTPLARLDQEVTLAGGEQAFVFSWNPPNVSRRGYGVDLHLQTQSGEELASAGTAFDVLERWTQNPRYGFLTDFAPGRADAVETVQMLTRYHINGLQFYDWMYRHEQFLTDMEPYDDLWSGNLHSRKTVDALIEAAHLHSIAAMPYSAVYGASMAFYKQHPDWVLYNVNGEPTFFGGEMMAIMDPRPDSPWTKHLLGQFDQVLEKTAFDGIHLDQYGDPKEGYDAQGNQYDLAPVLAELINQTKAHVNEHRRDGAVVFNAVTNWPIAAVAPADEDFVYIEVWPPYIWFNDLHDLVAEAQKISGGKPVVLAAYIDPSFEYNARLIDAVIFASGGGHIELGEKEGMLAEAYFPKYQTMSPALALVVQRFYDFAVRYQDVIGPQTQDITKDFQSQITVENYATSPSLMYNKVWPIVRQGEGITTINLVNLVGLERPEWKEQVTTPPTPLGPTVVHLSQATYPVSQVWFATPDGEDLSMKPLAFTQDGDVLTFTIPSLAYWDMIVIEWKQ